MREYKGYRRAQGRALVTVRDTYGGGREKPLLERFDLRRHSLSGYEWGFYGSGPAQLALALCCDALNDDARALACYQEYKIRQVALWQGDTWTTTDEEIKRLVKLIEDERIAFRKDQEEYQS